MDYTAWAKDQDFFTQTVYEKPYVQKLDYTSWFTGLTAQLIEEQADFDRQRQQAGIQEFVEAPLPTVSPRRVA